MKKNYLRTLMLTLGMATCLACTTSAIPTWAFVGGDITPRFKVEISNQSSMEIECPNQPGAENRTLEAGGIKSFDITGAQFKAWVDAGDLNTSFFPDSVTAELTPNMPLRYTYKHHVMNPADPADTMSYVMAEVHICFGGCDPINISSPEGRGHMMITFTDSNVTMPEDPTMP